MHTLYFALLGINAIHLYIVVNKLWITMWKCMKKAHISAFMIRFGGEKEYFNVDN